MEISIRDKRIKSAIKHLRDANPTMPVGDLETLFESTYHCKVLHNGLDPFYTQGTISFNDEKYFNFFNLQFTGYDDQ